MDFGLAKLTAAEVRHESLQTEATVGETVTASGADEAHLTSPGKAVQKDTGTHQIVRIALREQ